MKRITKHLVAACAIAMLASSITGCEGKKYDVTITFWHTMGQTLQEKLNRFIKEFQEIYPNVGIEHAAQGGYPDLEEKVSALWEDQKKCMRLGERAFRKLKNVYSTEITSAQWIQLLTSVCNKK